MVTRTRREKQQQARDRAGSILREIREILEQRWKVTGRPLDSEILNQIERVLDRS